MGASRINHSSAKDNPINRGYLADTASDKADLHLADRYHSLRHTFATIDLRNWGDIKTASSMLGHFCAGFTLDTYAHVTTAAQKEAADTMGNVLQV